MDAAPRRTPLQDRSKKRYESILDAAAVVFAEDGYDAATMEAIAARAETSIGSVYQFFENKRELFRALASRCLDRSRAAFELFLPAGQTPGPWRETLEAVVDGFVALSLSDSSFRAIWRNLHLYGEYADADEAMLRDFVERTRRLIGHYSPHLPPKKRALVAQMLVHATNAMLLVAFRGDETERDVMIAETKILLVRYLEAYVDEPA